MVRTVFRLAKPITLCSCFVSPDHNIYPPFLFFLFSTRYTGRIVYKKRKKERKKEKGKSYRSPRSRYYRSFLQGWLENGCTIHEHGDERFYINLRNVSYRYTLTKNEAFKARIKLLSERRGVNHRQRRTREISLPTEQRTRNVSGARC